MTDKELIKQEIERRIEMYKGLKPVGDQFYLGQISAAKGILQFIDSLPEEPGCEVNFTAKNEDLEEYAKKLAKGAALDKHNLIWMCKKGAEWQKQQDEELFKDDSWNYIEENYPNISQEEKLRLYDISIKSRLAGANSIKQKMVKDAVDATILDINAQTIEFGLWPEKLLDIKEGDKVKIIILK